MPKVEWRPKPCGCVKATLSVGRAMIRCERHRGKKSKRVLLHFDTDGIVRQ